MLKCPANALGVEVSTGARGGRAAPVNELEFALHVMLLPRSATDGGGMMECTKSHGAKDCGWMNGVSVDSSAMAMRSPPSAPTGGGDDDDAATEGGESKSREC